MDSAASLGTNSVSIKIDGPGALRGGPVKRSGRSDGSGRNGVGRSGFGRDGFGRDGGGLQPPVRTQPRPQPSADRTDGERARILTAILLHHPDLLHDVDHAYAAMALEPALAALREAIRGWADRADVLDSGALIDHLTLSGLRADVEQVLAGAPVPLPACASLAAMPAEAEAGWWHIFGFLNLDHLREEVKLAESEAAANLTQDTQRRALSLKAALNKVMAGEPDGVELAA